MDYITGALNTLQRLALNSRSHSAGETYNLFAIGLVVFALAMLRVALTRGKK